MATLSPDVTAALATLRSRWGAAAPRAAGEVVGRAGAGTLGRSSRRSGGDPAPAARIRPASSRPGFPELDAILGPGGLPRGMGLSLRGDLSSGRTTLALRLAAEAQAAGAIVAWLDLAAAFDPVEAVARGIRPEWLVVLTPADAEEGLAIAGALLSGRTVDLLVVDLPPRPRRGAARFADRLGRLAALARRAGISLVVLEPPGLAASVAAAVGEGTGIRLELARRAVDPPRAGRRRPADGGRRRPQPRRPARPAGDPPDPLRRRRRARRLPPPGRAPRRRRAAPDRGRPSRPARSARSTTAAPSMPPFQCPGRHAMRLLHLYRPHLLLDLARQRRPSGSWPAGPVVLGGQPWTDGDGPRRGSRGPGARRPARDAARVGPPAGPGGDLPRSGTGG